jgi:hypothetical protein
VHHHIGAGMGLKSHDARAIPLCTQCHRDYHDHNGIFRTMNRAQKLAWHGEKLALVSERVMHANEHDLAEEWDGVF